MTSRKEEERTRLNRYRNGSPWRDPDVLHVLLVGTMVVSLSLGTVYLWFFLRTWWVARSTDCDAGDAACVIVFGKRLRQGRPDLEYRWRLRRALHLARVRPHMVLLLSGGRSGSDDVDSEAEAGRDWLIRRQPDLAGRLHIETGSTDTIENLRRVREMLPAGKVALLSNRYHLARCLAMARHLGLDARAMAAEPALRTDRSTLHRCAMEAAYHGLFVIGRTWARLIGHRRMLARVS